MGQAKAYGDDIPVPYRKGDNLFFRRGICAIELIGPCLSVNLLLTRKRHSEPQLSVCDCRYLNCLYAPLYSCDIPPGRPGRQIIPRQTLKLFLRIYMRCCFRRRLIHKCLHDLRTEIRFHHIGHNDNRPLSFCLYPELCFEAVCTAFVSQYAGSVRVLKSVCQPCACSKGTVGF